MPQVDDTPQLGESSVVYVNLARCELRAASCAQSFSTFVVPMLP